MSQFHLIGPILFLGITHLPKSSAIRNAIAGIPAMSFITMAIDLLEEWGFKSATMAINSKKGLTPSVWLNPTYSSICFNISANKANLIELLSLQQTKQGTVFPLKMQLRQKGNHLSLPSQLSFQSRSSDAENGLIPVTQLIFIIFAVMMMQQHTASPVAAVKPRVVKWQSLQAAPLHAVKTFCS